MISSSVCSFKTLDQIYLMSNSIDHFDKTIKISRDIPSHTMIIRQARVSALPCTYQVRSLSTDYNCHL